MSRVIVCFGAVVGSWSVRFDHAVEPALWCRIKPDHLLETDSPIGLTAAAYPCAVALYLVRHGRPILDTAVPASRWVLDPEHEYLVEELAAEAPWPDDAVWYTSPEPKAARTAFLLAKREVPMVVDLREHDRGSTGWVPDFVGAIREAFTSPHAVARPGWEPIVRTRSRVVAAVRKILAEHPGRDVVLVGHGTAWTLLAAELTGTEPDLERWGSLAMPDVIVVDAATGQ